MRKGGRFLRLISLVTAAAALVMLAAALYRGRSTVRTDAVLAVTVTESVQVTGYFIRDERLLTAPCSVVLPLLREGEKVSAGERMAIGTEQSDLQAAAEELSDLRQRADALEQALRTPKEACAARIRGLLRQLAAGPPAVAGDTALLQALILRASLEDAEASRLLSDLRQQAEELTASLSGIPLIAPQAGWFSSCADGYESILTPKDIPLLKDPSLLPAAPVPKQAWGRLILSGTWYLAAMLPPEQLPEAGAEVTMTLSDGASFSMRVFRAERESGLLVLSCGSGLEKIAPLRSAFCTLTVSSREGLQFPAAALCTEESGQTFVYVAEGALARRKQVTVLQCGEDGCIAAAEERGTDSLCAGDAVLTGNDLYDGKVVYP